MISSRNIYQITLSVGKESIDPFVIALECHFDSVCYMYGDKRNVGEIVATSRKKPRPSIIYQVILELSNVLGVEAPVVKSLVLPEKDWVAEYIADLEPIRVGRFFVYSKDATINVPPSSIPLNIPANNAFGTGHHESTYGCLIALDSLKGMQIASALDVGCGSGILALGISKRWNCKVLALDIDEKAVRVAKQNIFSNGRKHFVKVTNSSIYNSRLLPSIYFNLIVSNIVERALVRMSNSIAGGLAPGGIAILSGLLESQEPHIIFAYRKHGLALVKRIRLIGWSTLIMQRIYGSK